MDFLEDSPKIKCPRVGSVTPPMTGMSRSITLPYGDVFKERAWGVYVNGLRTSTVLEALGRDPLSPCDVFRKGNWQY